MRDKKGSILMIALWVLAILVIFALGLGHRASINLRLARYQRDRLKADYLAKAGINRAIVEIINDQIPTYDSLKDNWADNKDVFKNISFNENKDEFATVSYTIKDDNTGEEELIYRAMDEERRVNINRIDDEIGKGELLELFKFIGLEEPRAEELRDIMVDWIDSDEEPEEEKKIFKNEKLKIPEELLLILEYFYQEKGEEDYQKKAAETFAQVKDLITVYTDNQININTVSLDVLTILANAVAKTGTQKNMVPQLVNKIIDLRKEKGYFERLSDINIVVEPGEEEALLNNLEGALKLTSNYFRIECRGEVLNISRNVMAVYDREKKEIIRQQN